MEKVLASWGLNSEDYDLVPITSGLINLTLQVRPKPTEAPTEGLWILQRLNTSVFKRPDAIALNLELAKEFINKGGSGDVVQLMYPVLNKQGNIFTIVDGEEYWRLIPYLEGSTTLDVIDNEEQAYEAARQFGKLTFILNGAPVEKFDCTIQNFHDLTMYYTAFVEARRVSQREGGESLAELDDFEDLLVNTQLRSRMAIRIAHHDCKLSNVLFSLDGRRGLVPIDLDTLMPGQVISDVGDMVRTLICNTTEHESNTAKVRAGMDCADKYFDAIIRGFLSSAGSVLSQPEIEGLTYAGCFMIYMQALRFAIDWLQGDSYYPINYPNQNLDRALNQLCLLKCVLEPDRRERWRSTVKEAVSPRIVDPW